MFMRILLKIPKVKSNPEGSMNKCPYCKEDILVRWGKRKKFERSRYKRGRGPKMEMFIL